MGQRAEGYYVRTHRWHYLWYADTGEQVLYDVTVDRLAEHNLVDQYPELVADFRERIDDWKREMGMATPVIIHE